MFFEGRSKQPVAEYVIWNMEHGDLVSYKQFKPLWFILNEAELSLQVKVYNLTQYEHGADDVLVMGTDGLWDVLSNEEVAETVTSFLANCDPDDLHRFYVFDYVPLFVPMYVLVELSCIIIKHYSTKLLMMSNAIKNCILPQIHVEICLYCILGRYQNGQVVLSSSLKKAMIKTILDLKAITKMALNTEQLKMNRQLETKMYQFFLNFKILIFF